MRKSNSFSKYIPGMFKENIIIYVLYIYIQLQNV